MAATRAPEKYHKFEENFKRTPKLHYVNIVWKIATGKLSVGTSCIGVTTIVR